MNPFKNTFTQITSFPLFLIHLHFFLFLLTTVISITPCSLATSHGCHEEERRALLNFKSYLDDPANRLSTWQDNAQHRNCCNWRGIGCSRDTFHVTSIDIRNIDAENYLNKRNSLGILLFPQEPPNTSLRGKLTPSLFNITHLEYLDLSFNDFQNSQIPHQFSSLPKLGHLGLSGSNFSALISTQFTNLSSLRYLDLSCKSISYDYDYCFRTSSTKWIRGLLNLQVLRLSGIDLSFSKKNSLLTSSLHNLTSLSVLELSGCGLHGSIPYLTQLKELDVRDNYDLHIDITRMFEHPWPKLQKLDISTTNTTGSIPSSISNAPLLASLSASGCSIQEPLPVSIDSLYRLQYLDLSDNNLESSLHSSISNLKHLNFLDLSSNNIQGHIPNSICEMFSLWHLHLRGNNITGAIPSCITNLKNISLLDLSRNSITGKVSLISLINELNLTSLDLSFNNLTVAIDQHLQLYRYILEDLSLQSCNLSFSIPTFICNLTYLKGLALPDTNLTGGIPSCISRLQNLVYLDLSNNKFRGPLPLPPQAVNIFDLSHNKLNGEISIEAGERLSRADIVMLNDNEISGSIPFSICSQEAGKPGTVVFSYNKLSGTIPSSIGYCRSLSTLKLGNNNLTGNVPSELGETQLSTLQLNNNNLDGKFPVSILRFSGLEVLDLGNNNFEGIIPTGLGSLKYLTFISLRSNDFTGFIPEDITQLNKLLILDLSMNKLTGPIPLRIGNLTMLTSSRSYDKSVRVWDVEYQLVIKGIGSQFKELEDYRSAIDLSCNILEGNIPDEICLLKGLVILNLSHNHFSNYIPASVGNMSSLESLDLSFNRLSGHIPQNLTSLDSLGFLNLSHNNLSGRIPRGNHFDTLIWMVPRLRGMIYCVGFRF